MDMVGGYVKFSRVQFCNPLLSRMPIDFSAGLGLHYVHLSCSDPIVLGGPNVQLSVTFSSILMKVPSVILEERNHIDLWN